MLSDRPVGGVVLTKITPEDELGPMALASVDIAPSEA
jgi:hypothetical protein